MVTVKSAHEIELMRKANQIVRDTLELVGREIKAGMTTAQVDKLVYDYITSCGAKPSFLGYEGYPASACVSINEEVVHGIPSPRRFIEEGDIVSVDVGSIYKGYNGDAARTFMIGQVSEEKKKLVEVTRECVQLGLEQVKPWGFLGDMAQAVYDHARANGYSIVREIGGHGCGLEFHEDPWVGYIGKRGTEMVMAPGMVFTIEPMVNMGRPDIFVDDENGWTVYTDDGMPSAQWEIQVLVTETGHEVLSY